MITDASEPIALDGTVIQRCRVGIEERRLQSLLEALGLPSNTPPELLFDLLRAFHNADAKTPQRATEIVSKSILRAWLGTAADVVGLSKAVVEFAKNRHFRAIVAGLARIIPV